MNRAFGPAGMQGAAVNNGATMDYLNQGRPVIQVTLTPCVYQPVKDVYLWNAWTKEMDQKLMLGAQMVLWELSGAAAVPFLRHKVTVLALTPAIPTDSGGRRASRSCLLAEGSNQ